MDVSEVLKQIEATLDGSIIAEPGHAPGTAATMIDLSQIDFEALEKKFARSKAKNTFCHPQKRRGSGGLTH